MSGHSKLAPCPFCGHQAKHQERHNPMSRWRHSIDCCHSECGMSGPVAASQAEAIALWNRRAALTPSAIASAGGGEVVWYVVTTGRGRDYFQRDVPDPNSLGVDWVVTTVYATPPAPAGDDAGLVEAGVREALRNLAAEMRHLLHCNPRKDGGLYRQRLDEADSALAAPAPMGELHEIEELLSGGQGDDDGPQILPDFEPGWSTLAKVEACLHLLEKRRDVLAALAAPAEERGVAGEES